MKTKRKPIGARNSLHGKELYGSTTKLRQDKKYLKKGQKPGRLWGFADTKTKKHRGQKI